VHRAVLALAGAIGVGCASQPPPVPLTDLGDALAGAVCDWAVTCRHVPDRPTCERLLDPKQYDTRRAEDAVAAGRIAYDPGAAGACVAATAGASCMATPFSDRSCGELFTGLVAEGGGCTSDYECVGGADCTIASCDAQCCLGSCGPPLTGEPPPPPELADVGEPCTTHTDCVVGAYCETDGRCTATPDREGERCLFGCARGDLYCDIDALVCKAYAGAGEPCDDAAVSAPPCDPAWSFCDGVCRPRPGAGEACDATRVCVASTWCDGGGTCQERGGAGDPCDDSGQCTVSCDGVTGQCVEYQTCVID